MNTSTCGKKAGVVLFLSLALNVFAAGYFFGHGCMRGWDHRGPFGGFSRQVDHLAEPAKGKVTAVLDQYRPKLKTEMQQVRTIHDQVETAMKNPDYSRKQVEVLFAKLKTESDKAQILAQQMMLDIADQLSPQERAKFFDHPHGHGPHDDATDKAPPSGSALPQ